MTAKKRWLYIFVCVSFVVLLSLGTYLLRTSDAWTTYTITRTEDGFVPEMLMIEKGTTVMFRNDSERAAWPASNDHPDHTGYPATNTADCLGSAFDACRGLEEGEAWSFTFEEPGSWLYHDHLAPGKGGVIVVKDKNRIRNAQSAAGIREVTEEELRNFAPPDVATFWRMEGSQRYETMVLFSKKDPAAAWDFLRDVGHNPNAPKNIAYHAYSHMIGNELYRQRGYEGVFVCDQSFVYGCNHGVFEAAVDENGLQGVPAIASVCLSENKSTLPDEKFRKGCFHGIGHGLVPIYNFDLRAALDHCTTLAHTTAGDRKLCYYGVFMEYEDGSTFKEFRESETEWEFCSTLSDEQMVICGFFMPFLVRDIGSATSRDAICTTAPHDTLRRSCIYAVGFGPSRNSIHTTSKSDIEENCALYSGEDYDDCIAAAAISFERNAFGDEQAAATTFAQDICTLLSSDAARTSCLSALEYNHSEFMYTYLHWRE